ncbi:MAG: undecaprenyl-phosphate glucose phosphotransferase [Geminicoccaceae bacterium]
MRITATDEIVRQAPPQPARRPDWLSPEVVTSALLATDAATLLLAGVSAGLGPDGRLRLSPLDWYATGLAAILAVLLFRLARVYRFEHLGSLRYQVVRLGVAWAIVMVAVPGLAVASGAGVEPLWLAGFALGGFGGLLVTRLLLRRQLRSWHRDGRLARNVVVVGAGEHGRRLVEHLRRHDQSVRLIGLFDDRRDRVPDYVAGYPVLGSLDDLLRFARAQPIDRIILALPWGAEQRLLRCIKQLRSLPVDIRLCPDVIGFHLTNRGVSHVGGVPLLNVLEKPLSGWDCIVKAAEDRVLAGLILLAIAPLMLAIALAVRLTSPGPVLFRQKRWGFNNQLIDVFKFRSMYVADCDAGEGTALAQATRGDRRVTPLGRFLRRTSLDELPQFLNVLRGEMSIVGPRPHAIAHNEYYARLIDEYLGRHRVKPGITGWAQVNGLRGETDTLEKMQRRVEYDLYYIDNWSLTLDLKIILMTLRVGFRHQNAY